MSLNADHLNNTGDYLLLLSLYFKAKMGNKALVLFEEDVAPQDPDVPLVIIPPVELTETQWADDGRHQDVVAVTVQVRVPNGLELPSVQAQNIGGFVRGYIAGELFTEYLNPEHECVDEPENIKGQPLTWNTNEQGYEVTFDQTLRYGTVLSPAFSLLGVESNQTG
ncbi:hypothetical protein L1D52_24105 [Vibrio brasiliensis]|uniref:hypothetical protein n=1 Tax=Vibrio brasiliensis TaxID=170652 RepID=UPI001EFDFB46|nr:hypothetical protein [Vibrio brasiliensis]MCG9785396.1 hypothetical protein [Vibrio brasiliensis]